MDDVALKPEQRIEHKRLLRVVFVERLPVDGRIVQGVRFGGEGLVLFVLGIKQLHLKGEVIAGEEQRDTGIDERMFEPADISLRWNSHLMRAIALVAECPSERSW